jgi:hypothetical protein
VSTIVVSPTNVATYPEGGGHFWVYMQYVSALRKLGCEVLWLEQFRSSGDPERDRFTQSTFFERMRHFGMEGKAVLCTWEEGPRYIGLEAAAVEPVLSRADLLLNFHYGIDPRLLERFRRTALIDIDPGLLQHWMHMGQIVVPRHDLYFTTGETVGTPDAAFPDCGLPWTHIRPCVDLELWPAVPTPEGAVFTTVSSWMGGVDGEWISDTQGGFYDNNKRVSFLRFLELPRLTGQSLELALCLDESPESEARARRNAYGDYLGDPADRRRLEENGWRVRLASEVASSPERYQKYIQGSRGEWSAAKPSCMKFRNAWISDRTLCYLATGRPAVVQDTGPSAYLPNGEGLFRFSTLEEAGTALAAIDANYDKHSCAAREIAEAWFDASRIVASLLSDALA